jgi:uncharacterized cupredoxin-like copper-binding protein
MKNGKIYAAGALVVILAVAVAGVWLVTAQGEREITIKMREFAFVIEGGSPLRIKAGETVQVKVVNEGVVEHELMVVRDKDRVLKMMREVIDARVEEGLEGKELIEAVEHEHHEVGEEMEKENLLLAKIELEPGEEGVLELRIDEPGTYWMVCLELEGSAPETHQEEGMVAQLIVEG